MTPETKKKAVLLIVVYIVTMIAIATMFTIAIKAGHNGAWQ